MRDIPDEMFPIVSDVLYCDACDKAVSIAHHF